MKSGAAFPRSPLIFPALERLRLAVAVTGFLMESRPLGWLGGSPSSVASWFLSRVAEQTARTRGRPNPMPGVVVVFPTPVMFGLSFLVLEGQAGAGDVVGSSQR